MKHTVHLYAVVRVQVDDVEAADDLAAIAQAEAAVSLYTMFGGLRGAAATEYAEEIVECLVDHEGDEALQKSRHFVWQGGRWVSVQESDIHHFQVCAAELHTILAALRYYQESGLGEPANHSLWIHDLATNCDQVVSLDDDGIDQLCQRLNLESTETPDV